VRSIIFGTVLILFGAAMTVTGLSGDSAFLFYFGMSIIPFAIGMILRYFGAPSRPVYSIIGLYLVVLWLLPGSVTDKLFGELNGDIEMFFLSGIFMVAGATVLIVQNLDYLLALVSKLGGLFKSKLPAVRTAVAFPGAAKGRTGMTVAMFSLIVFSLVMFATINENFSNMLLGDEATAGWDVRADQGNANPIGSTDDFQSLLQQRGIDTSDIEAAGSTTTNYNAQMRLPGTTGWKQDTVHGMDPGFLDSSKILFQQRATGYDSDQAIIDALKSQPNVAIIDASALSGGDDFGGDDDAFKLDDPDGDGPRKALTSDDKVFEPYQVEVRGSDGTVQTFTIIGIIDSKVSSMFGFFSADSSIKPLFPQPVYTSYYIKLTDSGHADAKAKEIETALLVNGVEGTSIRGELKDAQDQNRAFLYIIQGFMGLGLIVGIAAVGVIAFRSVVERRQQIGVLRAIGFQSSMVSLSFLIETAFVVGLGVLSGTTLGLVLARNLFADDEFSGGSGSSAFVIPWAIVVVILIVTIVAALLMTWMPARQASRLAPAEALRYE
jgi:putative ABC transport system permease protein